MTRNCLFALATLFVCIPLVAQEMVYPIDVAAHGEKIYIADRNLPGLFSFEKFKLAEVFKASKQFKTPLNATRCVAVGNKGEVYVADTASRQIFEMKDGKPTPILKNDIGIGLPMSISVMKSGDLVVADLELKKVYKVSPADGMPKELASIQAPRGVFVDGEDNVWVIKSVENPLVKITPDGKLQTIVEGRPFRFPSDLVVIEGAAYVCDSYSKAIWKVTDGKPVKWCEGPFVHPVGMSLAGKNILVADPRANAIFSVAPDAKATKIVGK